MTSETVDCETPARRATSMLVTRLSAAGAMPESQHLRRLRALDGPRRLDDGGAFGPRRT
jgi:hypothetical protein